MIKLILILSFLLWLICNDFIIPKVRAKSIWRNTGLEAKYSQEVVTTSLLIKHFNPSPEQVKTFRRYHNGSTTFQQMVEEINRDYPEWLPCFYANYMNYKKEGVPIREKYKTLRKDLDYLFKNDLLYEGKKITKQDYRVYRRKLVLLRQKELIENGLLVDDDNELERINAELEQGIKDKSLVCPHDPYPHNPYPSK